MGHDVSVVTEAELRAAVGLDLTCVDVIERAFAALASGAVVMPPILSMEIPGGHDEVDIKTAYIPGFEGFAVKVSTGFFGNVDLGLPSLSGLMVLFSAKTGRVDAVLLDNGYLTDLRTAAAGAVAARHLAPETKVFGVLGAGLQARLQARATHLVRPFERVLVWGRDADKAEACAAEIGRDLGVAAQAVSDAAEVVAASQTVVTTTPARAPILQAEWLHPGLHITAMGSDAPEKNEIAAQALARADLYVADRVSQCATLGELRSALAAGVMSAEGVPDLGEIATGAHPGRQTEAQITICDLTGTGAQDTAIASHVMTVLEAVGTVIRA